MERRNTSPGSSPTGTRLTFRLDRPTPDLRRSSVAVLLRRARRDACGSRRVSELCPRRGRTTSPPTRRGKDSSSGATRLPRGPPHRFERIELGRDPEGRGDPRGRSWSGRYQWMASLRLRGRRARRGRGSPPCEGGEAAVFVDRPGDRLPRVEPRPAAVHNARLPEGRQPRDQPDVAGRLARREPDPRPPTDQYLPPGMSGFANAASIPSRPDRHAARAGSLATRRASRADGSSGVLERNLRPARAARQDRRSRGSGSTRRSRSSRPTDVRAAARRARRSTWSTRLERRLRRPADFLNVLLSGARTRPDRRRPGFNQKLADAAALPGRGVPGALDADLARHTAPWAAYPNSQHRDFFSSRIGCQIFQPVYGMDLARLCARH